MKHYHWLGSKISAIRVVGQKTAKTYCGKTTAIKNLTITGETDCPDCIAAIAETNNDIESINHGHDIIVPKIN